MNPIDKKELLSELQGLMNGYWLSDLSNFCALLYQRVPEINWVGFYFNDHGKLRLGPFAGKPACLEIEYTRGVCGAAYSQNKTLIVDDVHDFPGHIACDPDSRSEIVIPLIVGTQKIGVLDVDSPKLARFSDADRDLFEQSLAVLVDRLQNTPLTRLENL